MASGFQVPRELAGREFRVAALLVAGGIAAVVFAIGFTTLPPSIRVALLLAIVGAGFLVRFGPLLAVLVVLVVSATAGRSGAHLSFGGIPALELVLAGGAALSVASMVALGRRIPGSVLIWVPAAVWATFLFVLHRPGSATAGIRELAPFVYPVLLACCFAAVNGPTLRQTLVRLLPWIVVLGVVTTGIGVVNQVTGNATVTSSGQLRALSSTFAPSCVAGLIAAVTLIDLGAVRRPDPWFVAGVVSATGLLLINHRSAFLAAIVAAGVALLLRSFATSRPSGARLAPRVAAASIALVMVLAVTPFGQASLARFAETGNRSDANIRDRIELTQRFMPHSAGEWVIGKGIGLVPAGLGRAQNDPEFRGVHNSYVFVAGRSGLVGGALLFVPMLIVLTHGVRRRNDPLLRGLTASVLFTAVLAAFNVTLENLYFSIWLWAPLLAIAALARPPAPHETHA